MKIALAQIQSVVGDVAANVVRIRAARAEAAAAGADLVVTPEFSVGGYPPEDLVRKPAFVALCEAAIADLAADTADGGPALIVGGPWQDGALLYNAAYVPYWPGAPSTSCRTMACSTKSACSTPARAPARSWCAACVWG